MPGVPGSGVPPQTPRYNIDRYAQSDEAIFSPQFNQAVDALDNSAKLSELEDEITRATAAEEAEVTRAEAAEAAETLAREDADTAEELARQAGDEIWFEHVHTMDDQTSPPQPAGSVVGHVFVPPAKSGEQYQLVGIASRAMVHGTDPSTYKVQTDTGHGDGTLADVTGIDTASPAEPVAGRYVAKYAKTAGVNTPKNLNDWDTVAIVLVHPGNSKGISVGLLFRRTHT